METLPVDITRQILCLVSERKNLTEFIRINKQTLYAADCDRVWRHYFYHISLYLASLLTLRSPCKYYSSPLYHILNIKTRFKSVFQSLKAEYSECLVMLKFENYDPMAIDCDGHSSIFTSLTRCLTIQHDDRVQVFKVEYCDETGSEKYVMYEYVSAKWVDNDNFLSRIHSQTKNSDCERILNYLQSSKNLIYSGPEWTLDELKLLSNAIHQQARHGNYLFHQPLVDHLTVITVKQFKELASRCSKSIQDDINLLFPD